MRYNPPFGTPEPPLGQYPRYINGNPVTGTEGSIPPARAFDEDQIEIVTVIQNTYNQLAADPSADPAVRDSLIPDHNKLHQLWDALQALFKAKYITTHIEKTVHGTGADF